MSYYALMIILVFLSSVSLVYAQSQTNNEPVVAEPPITVLVDKTSYSMENTVVVSGSVKAFVVGTPLTIQILDPTRNIIEVGQIEVAQDGKYTKTFTPGKLWKNSGTYTVKVQYGPASVVAETNFEFIATEPNENKIFEINAGNDGTFDVEYTITGGAVNDMTLDRDGIALIVSIGPTSDGILTIDVPRKLIDSKKISCDGEDDSFIVLIDGQQVEPQNDEKHEETRKLMIPFLEGDSDIEIVGTCIIPEFGAIAAVVLAIAIISIIAVSAKTRLMPKY